MSGRFDEKGDLWLEIGMSAPIPQDVIRSGIAFTRSVPIVGYGGAVGTAVTEINLTAYIRKISGQSE